MRCALPKIVWTVTVSQFLDDALKKVARLYGYSTKAAFIKESIIQRFHTPILKNWMMDNVMATLQENLPSDMRNEAELRRLISEFFSDLMRSKKLEDKATEIMEYQRLLSKINTPTKLPLKPEKAKSESC